MGERRDRRIDGQEIDGRPGRGDLRLVGLIDTGWKVARGISHTLAEISRIRFPAAQIYRLTFRLRSNSSYQDR